MCVPSHTHFERSDFIYDAASSDEKSTKHESHSTHNRVDDTVGAKIHSEMIKQTAKMRKQKISASVKDGKSHARITSTIEENIREACINSSTFVDSNHAKMEVTDHASGSSKSFDTEAVSQGISLSPLEFTQCVVEESPQHEEYREDEDLPPKKIQHMPSLSNAIGDQMDAGDTDGGVVEV